MTDETKAFDASPYLIKLKGKDYIEVKWRLVWFRAEHPNGHLHTELVEHHEGYAVMKATVSWPDGGSATGYGSEEAKDFGDYLEKAETKAIGRALGALGYGTQFTEEHTFTKGDEQRLVDSPVSRPRAAAQQQRPQSPQTAQHAPQPAAAAPTSDKGDSRLAMWMVQQGITNESHPGFDIVNNWLVENIHTGVKGFRTADQATRNQIITAVDRPEVVEWLKDELTAVEYTQEVQRPAQAGADLGTCPVHGIKFLASKSETGSPYHGLPDNGGWCNKWDVEKVA